MCRGLDNDHWQAGRLQFAVQRHPKRGRFDPHTAQAIKSQFVWLAGRWLAVAMTLLGGGVITPNPVRSLCVWRGFRFGALCHRGAAPTAAGGGRCCPPPTPPL